MSTPETTATSFVDEQLADAERTFKNTRRATLIICGAVGLYAIGVTAWLHNNVLQPTAAADIATAHAVEIVQQSGAALSDQIVHEVPAVIASAPDYLLEQMPDYRAQLENKFEQMLAAYGQQFEPEVEAFLDQFFNEHREQVQAILAAVNDPKMTKRFGDQLEQELLSYLKTPNARGESVLDLLDHGRVVLEDVEHRLDRLAHAKNLSAEEIKLRRIVAATLKTAHANL
ncbi:MAG: hypothetical protein PCFJNLEI_01777 [Verrucomicrobiae bacterium]|nr:hypothetical protein [Verrucomicrobiae bacterium]